MSHSTRTLAFNNWAAETGWPAVCDPDLAFNDALLANLHSLWRKKAETDVIPRRSQMTPRVLKPFLKNIAILERASEMPVRYRVRVIGTHLTEALGEMQGKYLDEVLPAPVALQWHARLDLTLAEGRPMRFVSRVDARQLFFLRSETFWAPLASEDKAAPPQVLVAAILSFNGEKRAGREQNVAKMI